MPSRSASYSSGLWNALWAVAAAFGCYFCMYMFRKPFTAAEFAGENIAGMSFKTLLVTSQVMGYTLSKFIGVKVVSEMTSDRRPRTIFLLIVLAQLALLLFAWVPRPWNAICLFFNGLPLGMVFGLVLGQLEGRRSTEALAAGLCTSFILADGMTKTVGKWLLNQGLSENWMPFMAGAMFMLPTLACVMMLSRVAPPNQADVDHRSQRVALDGSARWLLFKRLAIGLIPIIIMYLTVTILRSLRADFAPELWKGLGVDIPAAIYTQSETWVALLVLLVNGAAVLIHNNRSAFLVSLATCMLGGLMMAGACWAWHNRLISAFWFMVLVGQGLYLPYVAVHTTIFERLIALTRERANVGFLMYLVDSIGYLGYVAVMVFRNSQADSKIALNVFNFFYASCIIGSVVTVITMAISWFYFARNYRNQSDLSGDLTT